MSYSMIQVTNTALGAVAAGGYLPLGKVTRKNNCGSFSSPTYTTGTTDINFVDINDPGYHNVAYTLSGVASAAELITLNLVVNGSVVFSVGTTAGAVGDTVELTIPSYMLRAFCNCESASNNLPLTVQFQLTGSGISAGTSNLVVERVA